MSVSIGCLSVLLTVILLIEITKTESMNKEKNVDRAILPSKNQWRNQKETPNLNTDTPIDISNPSLFGKSSGICMPLYSCSSNVNRTVLIVFAAVSIVFICLRYQCAEYCKVKNDYDHLHLQNSQPHLKNHFSRCNENI